MMKKMISAVIISSMLASVPVMAMEVEEDYAEEIAVYDVEEVLGTLPEETNSEDTVAEDTVSENEAAAVSEDAVMSISEDDISEYVTGYVEMPWDREVNMTDEYLSFASVKAEGEALISSADFEKDVEIPLSYPANSNDKEKITEYLKALPGLRNQKNLGTCWAHATMSGTEFSQVKKGNADSSIDYSEMYLAYCTYRDIENPIMGDADAGNIINKMSDAKMLGNGGNLNFAGQFLSKGYGYVNEVDMPYVPYSEDKYDMQGNLIGGAIQADELYKKDTARLENFYIVDIKKDNGIKILKEAVMENGAVAMSFNISTDGDVLNNETSAIFNATQKQSNHAVAIVGWDDEYPVGNFVTPPQNPGAWLVRNSWGNDNKDLFDIRNYFWLSYEDKTINSAAYIYDATKDASAYDNNYFYDTQIHNNYVRGAGAYANVFTVQDKCNELLTEVMIEVGAATDYRVDVYTNLTLDSCPSSGMHEIESTTEGRFELPGIYTVSLNKPVVLGKDTKFSIIVNTTDSAMVQETGFTYDDGEGAAYQINCGLRRGQSFMLSDYSGGRWEDLMDKSGGNSGNICISAHTKYTEEVPDNEDRIIELTLPNEFSIPVKVYYSKKYHTYKDEDGKMLLVFSGDAQTYDSQLFQYTGKKIKPSKKRIIWDNKIYNSKGNFKLSFQYAKGRKACNAGTSAMATIKWRKWNKESDNKKDTTIAFWTVQREVTQKDYDEGRVIASYRKGNLKSLKIKLDKGSLKPKKKEYRVDGSEVILTGENLTGSFQVK